MPGTQHRKVPGSTHKLSYPDGDVSTALGLSGHPGLIEYDDIVDP